MARKFSDGMRLTALVVSGVVVALVLGAVVWAVVLDGDEPSAAVITLYPRADAARVAADVTPKITRAVDGIAGVSPLRAESRDGVSIVALKADDGLRLAETHRVAIRTALKTVKPELPKGLPSPILDTNGKEEIIAVALTQTKSMGPTDPQTLAKLARRLQERLHVTAGIDQVVIDGIRDRQLVVRVGADLADRYNIDPKTIATALSRASLAFRPLRTEGELVFSLRPDQFDVDSIGSIPINSGTDGSIVRLRNIATLELALTGSDDDWVTIGENLAVVLVVRPTDGRAARGWVGKVQRVLQEFRMELPRAIALNTLLEPPN